MQIRRSGVASLPVSGNGSMAAGVASSVAGDVAREAVETAMSERLDRSSVGGSSWRGDIARSVGGGGFEDVQRVTADGNEGAPGGFDADTHQDELLKFAMSDAFEERLMEFLEDRLLSEIERRGGRYGGGFA